MAKKPTSRRKKGTFLKGRSGNPNGRPRGTTNHDTDLRQVEDQAMELAANVCDEIKETVREALAETAFQKVIPLIEAITDAVKEMAQEGEIGPSSVALLRNWYDDYAEDGEGEIFLHIGLPRNCSWESFPVSVKGFFRWLTFYPEVSRQHNVSGTLTEVDLCSGDVH